MHAYFLREAWRSIRQHRSIAFTAVFSLTAALTVCGVFLLLSHNADHALRLIGDRREMVIYLRDGVTEERRAAVVQSLERLYGEATYVSKDQAWQEFSQQVGDPSLLEAVDQNPLPASLRVKLRPELLHYDAMDEAARQVAQFPEVEDVRFGGEWVRRLDELGAALRGGTLAVGLVVAVAILFLLSNTLRLSVLARRQQVEILNRLGAGDRFIATPFVLEAVLETALAAVLALGLMLALTLYAGSQIQGVLFLPPLWCAGFLAAALLLAWLAAWAVVARVLRSVGA